MAIFHLLNNLKGWFVYVFDTCSRLVLSFHACWYINGRAAARAVLYDARIMAGGKKDWDGAGVRSKWFPHSCFILSDFLEFRMKSRWRCVCRRWVSRGQSKSMAPTWGRAGGTRWGQNDTKKYLSLIFLMLFEGNEILAWMLGDVAAPNQTPVPHRLFLPWSEHLSLQDLNRSDWLDGTSCFDWCRLANSIFHQNGQAQGALGFSFLRRPAGVAN